MDNNINNNYFNELNAIDLTDKTEVKGNLTYLSWAFAWGALKSRHPDATYKIYERDQVIETIEETRYEKVEQELEKGIPGSPECIVKVKKTTTIPVNYFTDGRTAWVKVGVTVNNIEHIEELPVMNNKNASVGVGEVTSTLVNKSIQRALVKAIARHGLGLYIYAGEDLPTDYSGNNAALSASAAQQESLDTLKEEVINLMTGFFSSPFEADVDKYMRDLFKGTRISEAKEEDRDKLLAARVYLASLGK